MSFLSGLGWKAVTSAFRGIMDSILNWWTERTREAERRRMAALEEERAEQEEFRRVSQEAKKIEEDSKSDTLDDDLKWL